MTASSNLQWQITMPVSTGGMFITSTNIQENKHTLTESEINFVVISSFQGLLRWLFKLKILLKFGFLKIICPFTIFEIWTVFKGTNDTIICPDFNFTAFFIYGIWDKGVIMHPFFNIWGIQPHCIRCRYFSSVLFDKEDNIIIDRLTSTWLKNNVTLWAYIILSHLHREQRSSSTRNLL